MAVIVVSIVLLVGILGIDYLISLISFAEPKLSRDLTELQVKQVEIYTEMNKELMSLATLVLAGLGALISYVYFEGKRTLTSGQEAVLVASITLAALSIYMGYLSYDKTVWMLSKNFFNLDTPVLYWVRTLQLWSFIASIVLFFYLWLLRGNRAQ